MNHELSCGGFPHHFLPPPFTPEERLLLYLSDAPVLEPRRCLSTRNASGVNATRIPWQTLSHSVAKPGMRVWQSSSAAAGGVSTGEAHVAAAVADRHVAAVGAHRCVAHVLLEGQVLDVRTRCRGGSGCRGG